MCGGERLRLFGVVDFGGVAYEGFKTGRHHCEKGVFVDATCGVKLVILRSIL